MPNNTGIILYVDGLKNLYRRDIDISKPLNGSLTALQILYGRLKPHFPGVPFVLLMPDSSEFDSIAAQAAELELSVSRFSLNEITEKPLTLQQQRWALEDDSGNDTLLGEPIARAAESTNCENVILLPLSNLLADPAEMAESLQLYLREKFDLLFTKERVVGAGWAILQTELLTALNKQHHDLMSVRGGLGWILNKPLYPFRVGKWHCPRVKPRIYADLRLNSERTLALYSGMFSDDFASPDFSYKSWISGSGWEERYCDYAPLQIELEPVNSCEGRCFGCPAPRLRREKCEMPFDKFQKAAFGIQQKRSTSWLISGLGEPMLYPQIGDLLKSLYDSHVSVHTSLSTFPGDDFPWNAVDILRISLDSLSAEMFLSLRSGCSWENIVRFIDFSRARKSADSDSFPEIGVSLVRHVKSEKILCEFLKHWKEICKPVFAENFFRWPFQLQPDAVQWFQILGESEFMHPGVRTSSVNFEPAKRRPCRRALLGLNIQANGNVTCCKCDSEGLTSYGNIFKDSIESIWNSEAMRSFRRQHIAMDFEKGLPCLNCREWYAPE